jgi:tRNA A-37 threonylcarbamoyl transferase component Bud32
MTPERWRQIDELFDAALRIDPDERAAWLRRACGDDDELRTDVARLLAEDERAARDGFLTPPGVSHRQFDPTTTFPPRDNGDPRAWPETVHPARAAALERTGGFTPKAAIAKGGKQYPTAETESGMQVRLRELAMIYIILFGMTIVWRHFVLGQFDLPIATFNALVITGLGGIAAMLSGRRHFSLAQLQALELCMIVTLAVMGAFVQYRLMLEESRVDDKMLAQLIMKNVVLLTSILILTYGLYVPKSWKRAALVVAPLALMPFVTLMVLYRQHPYEMQWLWKGWVKSDTPRIALFSFDAMLLFILAVVSTYGAHTISLLRRQVAEARKLGQYHLRRRIGSGGMGEVYLAEHELLKRPCALKLIRPEGVADPNALERFEREVQITATLSHPNTVEIFDYGRTEDGTYYYVMEYLPGMSLAELVDRHGPLPPGRAVYLLRQVCLALREAHAAGLIHRDVKPSNVFAARRGGMDDVAKLLDFGLVRPSAAPRAADLSGEGQILGTPLFMSPEQARGGRELDERSDIYSLGAVGYYVLTGQPPFDDKDGIEVMIAHARDPVVPPSHVRGGIADDLERVVLRCLAKDPAARFPDAESLERALGNCSCASEWDQGRAARWWRDSGRVPAIPSTVA